MLRDVITIEMLLFSIQDSFEILLPYFQIVLGIILLGTTTYKFICFVICSIGFSKSTAKKIAGAVTSTQDVVDALKNQ